MQHGVGGDLVKQADRGDPLSNLYRILRGHNRGRSSGARRTLSVPLRFRGPLAKNPTIPWRLPKSALQQQATRGSVPAHHSQARNLQQPTSIEPLILAVQQNLKFLIQAEMCQRRENQAEGEVYQVSLKMK